MLYTLKHCVGIKCIIVKRNEFGDDFYIEMLNNITHLKNLEVLTIKSILLYIFLIH